MTLISSVIADAYRESNMIPLGATPTANQSTEALRLLNAVFNAIYGGDAGELLSDWPLGNYGRQALDNLTLTTLQITNPPINQRLVVTNTGALTVYLTSRPQDGSRMGIADPFSRLAANPVTLNANGWTIEDNTGVILNTNGLFREWIYRADQSDWVRISDKLTTDEMPFPVMFDTMFMILLAMRLNPRYGRSLDPQSMEMLKQGRRQFVARYLQSRPLEILDDVSWPFMSTQSYDSQRAYGSTETGFNRGNPWG